MRIRINMIFSMIMGDEFKVIFMARRFPPSVGGMERFAFDLSNALKEKVRLRRITWGGSNKWLPVILPLFMVRAFFALLLNRNIQIIHIQDAVQAPIGWVLHILFRKPYIVVAHGLDITYQNKFYQRVILPFVRRANMVVSISSATKDEAEARGVRPDRSRVITLGINDDYNSPKPDRKRLGDLIGQDLKGKKLILTTGRLVKRKGVEWFILNVLPKLVNRDHSILYLVAGDGAEKENIETAMTQAKMQKNILLLGRVSEEVRSLLYQSCDIFVMPNIVVQGDMEGFGIVAHEAATAKLPVIASNLEGIADAIKDGENGILLPSADVESYAESIENLLRNHELRKSFGKKAREFTLDNYSWGKIAQQYVEVYDYIIQEDQ